MRFKNFLAVGSVLGLFLALVMAVDAAGESVLAFVGIVLVLALVLLGIGMFAPLKRSGSGYRLLLFLLLAAPAHAQTTINFSACANGSSPGIFQTVDFTGGPWTCEKVWLFANDSLSWSQAVSSGTFKFASPEVLTTLTVGDVGSGGTLTITSDKGETFSAAIPTSKIVTLSTGFALAATTITIQYTDSWFLEISSLTYAGPPPPGISAKLTLKYSDGSVFTGSAQILAITTNPDGTTSTTTIASAVFDLTGTVSAFIQIDSTKSYNVQVLNPSGTLVYSAPALVQGFLIASLSKATLTATIDKTTGSLVSESYAIQ